MAAIVAVARLRPLASSSSSDPRALTDLAGALVALAARLQATGRAASAVPPLKEALALDGRVLETAATADKRYSALRELVAVGLRLALAHETLTDEAEVDQTIRNGAERKARMAAQGAAAAAELAQVVGWQRELEHLRPDQHLEALIATLRRLGAAQARLGQTRQALAVRQEMLYYYRELVRDRPDTFLPDLADCLCSVSMDHDTLGQWDAAFVPASEAVQIYRKLNAGLPAMAGTLRRGLARALSRLGCALEKKMAFPEAVAAHDEAVAIYRALVADAPTTATATATAAQAAAANTEDLLELAALLNNLASCLGASQRFEDALAAMRESIAVAAKVAPSLRPGFVYVDHASTLLNYGLALCRVGRPDEAVVPMAQSIKMLRQFEANEPGAHRARLAEALLTLAATQTQPAQLASCRATVAEAVAMVRDLNQTESAAYRKEFVQNLSTAAAILAEVGDLPAASAMLRDEVVPACRQLYASHPDTFLRPYKMALDLLVNVQARMGRADQVAVTRVEAAVLGRR